MQFANLFTECVDGVPYKLGCNDCHCISNDTIACTSMQW